MTIAKLLLYYKHSYFQILLTIHHFKGISDSLMNIWCLDMIFDHRNLTNFVSFAFLIISPHFYALKIQSS